MTSLTQNQIDMAISDLDPDLPQNQSPRSPLDIPASDREPARHRRELEREELIRDAVAVGFVVALIGVGFVFGYLLNG